MSNKALCLAAVKGFTRVRTINAYDLPEPWKGALATGSIVKSKRIL
ncbi:MAG: hypothetical protein WDO71_19070 [Bacteroidota bacterium]